MLNVNCASTVCALVDQMLPRGERGATSKEDADGLTLTHKGIQFSVHVALEYFVETETDREYSRSVLVDFLFFGNVHTYARIQRGMPLFRNNVDGYEHKSSHDSCWRYDGVESALNTEYFALCQQVIDDLRKDGHDPDNQIVPADMVQFNELGRFGSVFRLVNVETVPNRGEDYPELILKTITDR